MGETAFTALYRLRPLRRTTGFASGSGFWRVGLASSVYRFAKERWERRVFAIKGKGGQEVPYIRNPTTGSSGTPWRRPLDFQQQSARAAPGPSIGIHRLQPRTARIYIGYFRRGFPVQKPH